MPCYFPSADQRPRRNHKRVRYRSKVRGTFLETSHSAFYTQSSFYLWSAVCSLQSAVRVLHWPTEQHFLKVPTPTNNKRFGHFPLSPRCWGGFALWVSIFIDWWNQSILIDSFLSIILIILIGFRWPIFIDWARRGMNPPLKMTTIGKFSYPAL